MQPTPRALQGVKPNIYENTMTGSGNPVLFPRLRGKECKEIQKEHLFGKSVRAIIQSQAKNELRTDTDITASRLMKVSVPAILERTTP